MPKRRENQEGSTALGLRIKNARSEKKLTQQQLADKSHCTKGAVSQWEKGNVVNLRLERLFEVADALGVEARWLAIGVGPRYRAAKGVAVELEEGEALSRLRGALPKWRAYVLSLAMTKDHKKQQLFLDMLSEHVPDEAVAEAYGHPGEKKK